MHLCIGSANWRDRCLDWKIERIAGVCRPIPGRCTLLPTLLQHVVHFQRS